MVLGIKQAEVSYIENACRMITIQEILNLKVNLMSPLEALNELDRLQNRLKNRWEG